ncbi:Protein MLT-7 [Aphelenchoides avenae]|nr:Protein MLT-7 [Aphelenchus avenae]
MVEDPVVGGMVGQTLACIIGDQFKRTRDGDRFYFENPGIFTPAQLEEVKKSSLSRVICDNGDHITEVPAEAFVLPKGGLVPCSKLPHMDLTKWKE